MKAEGRNEKRLRARGLSAKSKKVSKSRCAKELVLSRFRVVLIAFRPRYPLEASLYAVAV